MRRRRHRRNPEPVTMLIVAGIAAVGLGAIFLLRKKTPPVLTASTGQQFATQPAFTTGLPTAEGLLVGDCITVVNGQAGFSVDGVPSGENTIMKVTASPGKGGNSVVAASIDDRVSDKSAKTVPTAAISGGGDCT